MSRSKSERARSRTHHENITGTLSKRKDQEQPPRDVQQLSPRSRDCLAMEDLDDQLALFPSRAAAAPTAPLPNWLVWISWILSGTMIA